MTAIEHEAPVVQPAHQLGQMDLRHVRDVEGIKYLEEGEGEGAPILFLHGIGGGAAAFLPQLAHFGRTRRALAWEMPGYAGSVPLPVVTMEALAASLGNFIRALGLDRPGRRPVLVGHSLGGMVVQRLLVEAPHIARAVVLSQTAAAFGGRDPAWAATFVADRLAPLDAGQTMRDLAAAAVRDSAAPRTDESLLAAARACFAAVPESTYRDMILAMPGFDERAALPRIAVPALVLAGSEDRSAPPAGCEKMAAQIPGARFTLIPGAGHLAHAEHPAAFNAALDEFLETLTPI